jgi:CTP synthase (UTP-ammonia lyase)
MPEDAIAALTAGASGRDQSNRLQQPAAKLMELRVPPAACRSAGVTASARPQRAIDRRDRERPPERAAEPMGYRRGMARIALLGDRDVRFLTHRALDAVVARLPGGASAEWIGTDTAEARSLDRFDRVWVVPGTPYRDDGAVLAAIDRAIDSGMPLLATCGGFQYTLLALARRAGVEDPAHAELEPDALDPVVAPLSCSLEGEEREVTCVPGTRLAAICGMAPFAGFHWRNYGLADPYVARLASAGVVVSARAPDAGVEGIELPDHPFFLATLFQPQIGELKGAELHPLIAAFVAEAA